MVFSRVCVGRCGFPNVYVLESMCNLWKTSFRVSSAPGHVSQGESLLGNVDMSGELSVRRSRENSRSLCRFVKVSMDITVILSLRISVGASVEILELLCHCPYFTSWRRGPVITGNTLTCSLSFWLGHHHCPRWNLSPP